MANIADGHLLQTLCAIQIQKALPLLHCVSCSFWCCASTLKYVENDRPKPLLQSWSLADSLSTLSAARCCDSSAYRASSSFTPYTLTQLANSGNVEKFSDEDNS
ncbi:hypothetical protein T11_6905 [Trichinella zimbabwensis]|uniref:Uncharacterized protein n=1 Tax=Trichinella zimbabwensis TaxID=268475 RepID=A0A0V1HUG4_9BILA|nr:hypothetical protein T11_6905 [Trichinella zimbabwensis]